MFPKKPTQKKTETSIPPTTPLPLVNCVFHDPPKGGLGTPKKNLRSHTNNQGGHPPKKTEGSNPKKRNNITAWWVCGSPKLSPERSQINLIERGATVRKKRHRKMPWGTPDPFVFFFPKYTPESTAYLDKKPPPQKQDPKSLKKKKQRRKGGGT